MEGIKSLDYEYPIFFDFKTPPSFSRTLLTTHYSLMIGQHRYVIHHLGRWVHLSGMSTLKHINLCALIDHLGEG